MSNNLSYKNILPTETLFLFYKNHQIYSFPVLEVLDAPYCTFQSIHTIALAILVELGLINSWLFATFEKLIFLLTDLVGS